MYIVIYRNMIHFHNVLYHDCVRNVATGNAYLFYQFCHRFVMSCPSFQRLWKLKYGIHLWLNAMFFSESQFITHFSLQVPIAKAWRWRPCVWAFHICLSPIILNINEKTKELMERSEKHFFNDFDTFVSHQILLSIIPKTFKTVMNISMNWIKYVLKFHSIF